MLNQLPSSFYSLRHPEGFFEGIQKAVGSIEQETGIYAGDNLFTYHRNLSFLEDEALMLAFNRHATTSIEQSLLWRVSTLLWGVRNGLRLEGDFVECACYKGTTARILCGAVNFAQRVDHHYYLYDLFDHDPSMPHHAMSEHGDKLYAEVKARFSDTPNVTVTQGKVPEVLAEVAPQKIAFMHLDLNNVDAEMGTLEILFDRLVPGAMLVFDDYGWMAYRKQKLAEAPWLAARGYRVLELPTGQGLVIK